MTNKDKTITIDNKIDKDSLYYNILSLNKYVDKDIRDAFNEYNKSIDKEKIKDFIKDKDYWIQELDDYIQHLNELDKEDISNISKQELKEKVVSFNVGILKNFFVIKRQYARDLISDKDKYSLELASTIVDLQIIEINNIGGIDAFCKLNLDKDKTLKQIMKTPLLKEIQQQIKDNIKLGNTIDDDALKTLLFNKQLQDSIDKVEKIISDDKEYYNKLHRKYNKIDKLITIVGKKYKARDEELKEVNELSDIQQLENEITISDTSDTKVKKDFTKLPTEYVFNFDEEKLFNNIYPNYKYKSIDEDRHKRLINGFINVRDNQDSIDRVIPLLSVLKYITANKNLRLPTSKKDLKLYEDFMLFFDRCKIQVKIEDRQTKDVLFEIMQPMSLLSNTPAYNGKYGYVIGNSVLNLLKNELDKLYTTPNQTTFKTNKSYLQNTLPKTPTTINIDMYIRPKIAQMINSYQKRATYNGKINIIKLYDFQAMYNEKPKPDKDDKAKVREMLNKYLDNLVKKDVLISYTPIKKGKEIEQYKVEINKNAKL